MTIHFTTLRSKGLIMILRIEHYFGNIIFCFFQDIAPDELISINVLKKTTTEKKNKKRATQKQRKFIWSNVEWNLFITISNQKIAHSLKILLYKKPYLPFADIQLWHARSLHLSLQHLFETAVYLADLPSQGEVWSSN